MVFILNKLHFGFNTLFSLFNDVININNFVKNDNGSLQLEILNQGILYKKANFWGGKIKQQDFKSWLCWPTVVGSEVNLE